MVIFKKQKQKTNLLINDSATLAETEVTETGQRSDSKANGRITLGIGTTPATFHQVGTIPCLINEFITSHNYGRC